MKHFMDIVRVKENEESELIGDCTSNKYFGKAVGSQAMNWAKKIILGA